MTAREREIFRILDSVYDELLKLNAKLKRIILENETRPDAG